ncbi:MAG TPA: HAMP domain-containing protein [Blastocatellia bacterium]|nr:HAMP domain-containing protein [Blastocatellia bacterium]
MPGRASGRGAQGAERKGAERETQARLARFQFISMRLGQKAGLLCAAAAAVPLIIAGVIVAAAFSSHARGQALDSLRSDARAASSILEKRLDEMKEAALGLATDISIRALPDPAAGPSDPARGRLQDILVKARDELSLDFVIVADPTGRVIARHNDVPAPGETILKPEEKNLIGEKVLSEGNRMHASTAAACAVERTQFLQRLWLNPVARVDVRSKDKNDQAIQDALIVEACAPIYGGGRFAGVVLAGQVLNNYYKARAAAGVIQTPLVAEIRRTLFPEVDTDAGALAALGDTIVASSVHTGSGAEPLLKGLKRSPALPEEVMASGQGDYAVAWQPVKSIDGSEIGAIGVAVPAKVLDSSASQVKSVLVAAFVLAVVAAAAAGFWFGRSISSRITVLSEAVNRMTVGELSAPVRDNGRHIETSPVGQALARARIKALTLFGQDVTPSNSVMDGDEIGDLAEHLDQMRESFRQAIERMRRR